MSAREGERDVAIVTDGFIRKALAAVRSLGRRGVRVVACGTTAFAPGLLSRYAWRRVVHPPLAFDRAGFLDAIEAACRRYRPRAILAMEEETLLALLDERARFEALGARLPYADPALIRRFSDKLWTLERARSLGLETPRTWTDPARAAAEADFPLVVKPRRGSGAFGVQYAQTPVALARLVAPAPSVASHPMPHCGSHLTEHKYNVKRPAEALPLLVQERPAPFLIQERPAPFLIQERLAGPGLGVSLLYDQDRRLCAQFSHRRLREWPSTGGSSTLRESARLPEIEAASRALLEAENFVGPAMVEWKLDPRDGRAKLLEVNPRFWGSLALAIRSGVDFPWLLHRIARGDALPAEPAAAYRTGVRARWFLPGDLMHFVERRDWRGLARSLWPGCEPPAPDDVFSRDDAGAALGALLFSIPFALRAEFRRFRRLARA